MVIFLWIWVVLLRVGNEEYQYKPLKHWECQKQPSGLPRTYNLPDLMGASGSGAEYYGIMVQGSNTKETRPEGSDLLY